MIAIGIGLHNLGEGLAIGAAYSIGAASLGTFLVIGFILQNLTEGLGIIAPILRYKPSLGMLTLLGLIGGVPAIIGAWTGGLIYWVQLASKMRWTILTGVFFGMLLLYITGLMIK